METIEQEILSTEKMIAGLPTPEARTLERSLRSLSPAQRAYVTGTLRTLQCENSVSPRYLQLLEHFFEKWSGHGLATKLVLIGRITQLSSQTAADPGATACDFQELFSLPPALQRAS